MSIKLERLGNIFTEAISKVIHEEVKDDDKLYVPSHKTTDINTEVTISSNSSTIRESTSTS